jgi:hypothetical protein
VATVVLAAYGQTQLNFKFLGGPDDALQVDDVSLFLQFLMPFFSIFLVA